MAPEQNYAGGKIKKSYCLTVRISKDNLIIHILVCFRYTDYNESASSYIGIVILQKRQRPAGILYRFDTQLISFHFIFIPTHTVTADYVDEYKTKTTITFSAAPENLKQTKLGHDKFYDLAARVSQNCVFPISIATQAFSSCQGHIVKEVLLGGTIKYYIG